MNKILMSTGKNLNGKINVLEIKNKDHFIIEGKVFIKKLIFKDSTFEVNFLLKENAELIFGETTELENIKGKISIFNTNYTKLDFRFGIHSKKENELYIENTILGNFNKSEIRIRIISDESSKIFLKTMGILEENTKENEFLEDIKYLNEYPSSITCLPELLVSSNEVVANHFMTVGNISEEVLFYLQSRGISEDISKQLIRENYINCMKREEDFYECTRLSNVET